MKRSIEWIAGLFEGEGTFSLQNSGKKETGQLYLRLAVQMTDEDVIRSLHESCGVGNVYLCNSPAHQARGDKPQWRWEVLGKDAIPLAMQLAPHLHSRRHAKLVELMGQVLNRQMSRPLWSRGKTVE